MQSQTYSSHATVALDASLANVAVAAPTPEAAGEIAQPPAICHVTLAHRELKSRTFYMQFAPLAALGIPVTYVSPASRTPPFTGRRHLRRHSHRATQPLAPNSPHCPSSRDAAP